jgi:hypothetical protein
MAGDGGGADVFFVGGDPVGCDLVLCRHFMLLTAFFMKRQPAPGSLIIERRLRIRKSHSTALTQPNASFILQEATLSSIRMELNLP